MKKTFLSILCLIAILSCNNDDKIQDITSLKQMRENFIAPPLEARPRALWDWVDGNFDKEEITREMEEAVAKGMGGFDIWDVRKVVDEDSIVPAGPAFMSDEYIDAIVYAINEAERLKLDLGLIVASGWNAGGAWTKPEHQMMGLYHSDSIIDGGKLIEIRMNYPILPEKIGKKGDLKTAYIPIDSVTGLPIASSEISVIAIPFSNDSLVSSVKSVINLSEKMDKDGKINWTAPSGKWKIIRYVCTNTGQGMIASTPNSGGPMIDHFNAKATEDHINFFIEKIEAKLNKPIGKSGLKYLYTDSYEVVGQLWTPELTKEFEKRMGYSMIPFLPVFNGYTIENIDISRRFMYDYRKVWSDLIVENHYAKAREICEKHGIGFVAEAAGPGWPIHNCPFESLKSSGVLSFPRGEFWHLPVKTEYWKRMHETSKGKHYIEDLQVIKGVSCASHIYNQKFVEAEAFTGTHLWGEGPGDLKPTADRAFCEGLNRIIFHTWPHTPKSAGVPGYIYAFGTLHNENLIWWPMAKPWMDYLGRCSYLLQTGNFHADVLFYYGDSAPNFVPAKHIHPMLGYGFDYDVTNTDILMNKITVKDGKLFLPHGQSYQVLVLPDEAYIIPEILEKIKTLIDAGAIVVGNKPSRSHGLKNWQKNDARVKQMADELWNEDASKTKIHAYSELRSLLNNAPDFDIVAGIKNKKDIDFIHRKTDSVDMYFIRNGSNKPIDIDARFRIGKNGSPEYWDPMSGNMSPCKVFIQSNDYTTLPISLEPFGSVFVVFTNEQISVHTERILLDEKQLFPLSDSLIRPFRQCTRKGEGKMLFTSMGNYSFVMNNNSKKNIIVNFDKMIDPIKGSWQVSFPIEKKGPGTITMPELISWKDAKEEGIKYFSGIATYTKEIEIPSDKINANIRIAMDLGKVFETAHVSVNGKEVGILWAPPYRTNISEFVKAGTNTITIKIANTWHNRLCGDAKLPIAERITKTNATRLPNAWSYPMKDIPNKDYGLMEGGLLGPVNIIYLHENTLE